MYDPEFVNVVRSFEFVDHHIGDLTPSVQANSILDEEVDERCDVIADVSKVCCRLLVKEDGLVYSKMSPGW